MQKSLELLLATFLALIFAIALFYVSLLIISPINQIMLGIIVDYQATEVSEQESIIQSLMPFGIIALFITLALIVLGLAIRRGWLAAAGSAALYIPVFGSFSSTMFFLAGIGALRVLWLPIIELNSDILRLGHVFLLPYFLLVDLLRANILDLLFFEMTVRYLAYSFMFLGIMIFLFGIITWLYAKFQGFEMVNFWIYKYSRHPQYLGYLVWSYGVLLDTTSAPLARGGLYLIASFPWLVGVLIIIAVSLSEEIKMVQEKGELYSSYRSATPFLVPLPKRFTHFIQAPLRLINKSNLPETNREILVLLLFYGVAFAVISIPFIPF